MIAILIGDASGAGAALISLLVSLVIEMVEGR
jgi:hypothetical protein